MAGAPLAKLDGFSRYPKSHGPACAEVCPREAVIYGTREELLTEAKRRLAEHPDRYVPKIYGETDGGGTQCLYLSHVPFEDLGLPRLSDRSVPDVQQTIQHGIYQGFDRAARALRPARRGRLPQRRKRAASEDREAEKGGPR